MKKYFILNLPQFRDLSKNTNFIIREIFLKNKDIVTFDLKFFS